MEKMRSEKKRRRGRPKRKLQKIQEEFKKSQKYDIPGVTKLNLSTLAQKAVGCVIGENLTTEYPWVYVKKERIEDNLDLHEESSEFLAIKPLILEYPDENILIGFNSDSIDDTEEFFICTTLDAKDQIEQLLENELNELQERLRNSLRRIPGQWTSLGSEIEVNENKIYDKRPLIEVEIEVNHPIRETPVRFSLRPVEAVVDGYVEILPGRFPFDNVFRKRVDAMVQVTPRKETKETQTEFTYPKNIWTQYQYEYEEAKLDVNKNFIDFMVNKSEEICKMAYVNDTINLHDDDYETLIKKPQKRGKMLSREFLSFVDVMSCKDKLVSSLTWHPLISGLIAAAYVKNPKSRIIQSPVLGDEVQETVYNQHLVLVWSYTDALLPKLYLHAPRDVMCVSFCPHKSNILVGGCSNGQIVIWDIKNKLEQVEFKEIITTEERENRVKLNPLMNWMKHVSDVSHLQPAVVSEIDYSHKAAISDIIWISPDYEITRNGKLLKLEDREDWSLQFYTCGLDSVVHVWDLRKIPRGSESFLKKKTRRRRKGPATLSEDISAFAYLNHAFKPIYKIMIEEQDTSFPITHLIMKKQKYVYTPQNPETLDSITTRTYFTVSKSPEVFKMNPEFIVTTNIGKVMKCSFDGYSFDQGQNVNAETYRGNSFLSIHDGPINLCMKNPFNQNVFLTVGGRVFAVWEESDITKPLFWRKSNKKYIGGVWSAFHLGVIILSRYDTHFEVWDLSQRTFSPGRNIRFSGNDFVESYSESTKAHTRKNTFCATDSVGTIKIYALPPFLTVVDEADLMRAMVAIRRIHVRRTMFKIFTEKWKALHSDLQLVEWAMEKPEPLPRVSKVSIKDARKTRQTIIMGTFLGTEKWKVEQEKFMYETLLKKKKLNLAEIELHKVPLRKIQQEKRTRRDRLRTLVKQKDDIFQMNKNLLLKKVQMQRRESVKVDIQEQHVPLIKSSYVLKYNEVEKHVLHSIKKRPYRYVFDWFQMINKGKERRQMLCKENIFDSNTHKQRYAEKKRQMSEVEELKENLSFTANTDL